MDDILAPRFIDPVAARKHLEALRWPNGAECPHCNLINATAVTGGRDGLYQCNSCREQFTVTVGTVFERSKVALNKWLLCNHLLCSSKKGMSAHQIHRMLGVTYKTAWFMCHRLRAAMVTEPTGPLGGAGKTVEADETFVGGKQRRNTRPVAPKKVVVSLVERGGEVRSFHFRRVHGQNIKALVFTNVDRASNFMTDQAHFYGPIGKEFASHHAVLHSIGEYVRGDAHSNTAENFFSIFKRGVIGTYHHLSEQHLARYTAEFDFRYNTRKENDRVRADLNLVGIGGKRLTYRRTDKLAA
jgi:transposase-like protein